MLYLSFLVLAFLVHVKFVEHLGYPQLSVSPNLQPLKKLHLPDSLKSTIQLPANLKNNKRLISNAICQTVPSVAIASVPVSLFVDSEPIQTEKQLADCVRMEMCLLHVYI